MFAAVNIISLPGGGGGYAGKWERRPPNLPGTDRMAAV